MTEDHFRDDVVEDYHLENEGEYMLITYDDRGYKLEHKKGRFGATETIIQGFTNLEDVKQVLVGQAERMGKQNLKNQVMEGKNTTYVCIDEAPTYFDRDKLLDEVLDQ